MFDYHSHISEKNNMTVRWLLLTVSPVVSYAGLIYLHNYRLTGGGFGFGVKKYLYEAIWSLQYNLLISRKYNHFSDYTESCIESHSLHAPEMFCAVPTAQQEGETTDQTFYFSVYFIGGWQTAAADALDVAVRMTCLF